MTSLWDCVGEVDVNSGSDETRANTQVQFKFNPIQLREWCLYRAPGVAMVIMGLSN